MSYTLIDPPVTPFSTREELEAWLVELRAKPQSPQRDDAIAEAEEWLADAR